MSNFEQRAIEAFERLEMMEHELTIGGFISSAGRISQARMDINAYVCELKLQRMLNPEVK